MTGFTFSIIMAIYNSQDYLKESIESVLNQSLDFTENIQLILVDDGSCDDSYKICQDYKEKYSNNIILIKKENNGPASARNLGLKYAEGFYINFLDSDDKLSVNALFEVNEFFKKYNTDLVTIPIEYFGVKTGEQYMNYKFAKTQLIDLNEVYDYPQLSSSTCFIKKEVINDLRFNERLVNGEDLLFVNEILLDKMNYGVLNTAKYYYRKHRNCSSLMDKVFTSPEYFTPKLKECFIKLIDYSLTHYCQVFKFIQYVIIQDLHGIIRSSNFNRYVSDKKEFYHYLKYILSFIDEDIIISQRKLDEHAKSFLIFVKNNEFHIEKNSDKLVLKSKEYTINNTHNNKIRITKLDINKDFMHVEGYVNTCCYNNDLTIKLNEYEYNFSKNNPILSFAGIDWLFKAEFTFTIPINDFKIQLLYDESVLNNQIVFMDDFKAKIKDNTVQISKNRLKRVLNW